MRPILSSLALPEKPRKNCNPKKKFVPALKRKEKLDRNPAKRSAIPKRSGLNTPHQLARNVGGTKNLQLKQPGFHSCPCFLLGLSLVFFGFLVTFWSLAKINANMPVSCGCRLLSFSSIPELAFHSVFASSKSRLAVPKGWNKMKGETKWIETTKECWPGRGKPTRVIFAWKVSLYYFPLFLSPQFRSLYTAESFQILIFSRETHASGYQLFLHSSLRSLFFFYSFNYEVNS